MEYIDGETLAEYATGTKHLRDREAIDVALDVLGALGAIHPDSERLDKLDAKKRSGELSQEEYGELMSMSENSLVHRDIKPQNIMLTRSGAKLLDFNMASRVGDSVHTVSGTPRTNRLTPTSPVGMCPPIYLPWASRCTSYCATGNIPIHKRGPCLTAIRETPADSARTSTNRWPTS